MKVLTSSVRIAIGVVLGSVLALAFGPPLVGGFHVGYNGALSDDNQCETRLTIQFCRHAESAQATAASSTTDGAAVAASIALEQAKADDANAKAVVRTAQTAEETYFTDKQTYATAVSDLGVVEPTLAAAIPTSPTNVPNSLTVNSASGTGFNVSVTSGSTAPVVYMIANDAGTVTRDCSPAGTGGCDTTGTW